MPDPFVTAIYVYNMYMCISQAKNIHVAIHDVMTEPHKIIIYFLPVESFSSPWGDVKIYLVFV